jgi:DNA-binding transcriptional MerR regulator
MRSSTFPDIPLKRYFSISEASELCLVEPHILRYWEKEFTNLKPMKRVGKRRYYQEKDIVLIRKIHNLLYEEGFTVVGAKQKLQQDEKEGLHLQQKDEIISTVITELESILADLKKGLKE